MTRNIFLNKWSLNIYVDIKMCWASKFRSRIFLTNLDVDGNPNIDPATAALPYEQQKYILRSIPNESGTIVPTIGIIAEF
ncbi:MAG: hypothetical protein R2764_00580 [Bacteroidales bacterium]